MFRTADTNRNRSYRTHSAGMTLIELVLVVTILGLLSAIAYPMYQDQVNRSRRSDGQSLILDVAARMERFYFDNTTYTTDLTALGYTSSDNVPSTEGHYTVTVTGCPIASCFLVTASPAGAQQNDTFCGNLTLNSMGVKGKSGTGPLERCW